MPSWPVTLPGPMIGGYNVQPIDPTVRTDMEIGTSRVRQRTAARNDRISLQWKFTDTEMAAFRSFFDNDIAGGSSWFTLSLATGDGGLIAQDVRFVNGFSHAPSAGLNWLVSATMETR